MARYQSQLRQRKEAGRRRCTRLQSKGTRGADARVEPQGPAHHASPASPGVMSSELSATGGRLGHVDENPQSSAEGPAGASAIPLPIASAPTPSGDTYTQSLFTRELWLSASHILREFAPLQQLSVRKEDEEANDDESDDDDSDGGPSERRGGATSKLLLVMVGLPARGKSFISHRLTNYLTWYGLKTRVFNVGAYRRAVGGNEDAEFFDAANKAAAETREHLAWTVFGELLQWLTSGKGDVGIFDATNTTDQRRRQLLDRALKQCPDIKVLFIESICDDPKVLEANLQHKVKSSPDFVGVDPDKAKADFLARIRKYEQVYKSITDDSLSYIKVINLSSKVVCNQIHGRTQHRILAFLMSLHVIERPVWLVRPGPVDVESSVYMGSCHPGVVAHQLQSPKNIPADLRHQASARSNSFRSRTLPSQGSGSPLSSCSSTSNKVSPDRLPVSPAAVEGDRFLHAQSKDSSETNLTVHARASKETHSVGKGAEEEATDAASTLPIEPPEMVLSEDEDDYWGSFKGIASWQKTDIKDAPELDLYVSSADHPAKGNAQYSFGAGIPARNPPPGTAMAHSLKSMGISTDSRHVFDLVIPHPSADGASLNTEGKNMARQLGLFIGQKCAESGWTQRPRIFTSTLPRAIETGQICADVCAASHVESVSALNPVDVGACHGMTLGEIRQMLGQEQLQRMRKRPGNARLPGGESQFDVTKRLEPFIVDDLERQMSPVVVISHLSTLQILYEYFLGSAADAKDRAFWALSMPVGTVVQLVARFGGAGAGVSWQETRFDLNLMPVADPPPNATDQQPT